MKAYLVSDDDSDDQDTIVLAYTPEDARKFLIDVHGINLRLADFRELESSQNIKVNSRDGNGHAELSAAFWCELFHESPRPVLLSYPQED